LNASADLTVEQHRQLDIRIDTLRTGLVGLNNELLNEQRNLQRVSNEMEVQMVLFDRRNAELAASVRTAQFERETAMALAQEHDELEAIVRENELIQQKAQQAADAQKQQFLALSEALNLVHEAFARIGEDDAMAVARNAMDEAARSGRALADIIQDIKFKLDFSRELDLIGSGLQSAVEALQKFDESFRDEAAQIAQSAKDIADKIGGPVVSAFERLRAIAATIFAQMRQSWAQAFGEMAVGLRGFLDFAQTLWDAFRQAVANIIAQMVQDWLAKSAIMKAASNIFSGIFHSIPIIGPLLGLFGLQHGGIVTRPTPALIGEAGPEAVIPLSHMGGLMGGGGGGMTVILQGPNYMDQFSGWELSKTIAEEVRKQTRRESMRPNRLANGRPAAAWTGGGDASHTSFKSLRR
jgi:hypothetical protein